MRSFLTITFVFIAFSSKAIGLGDWLSQTPGGNEMGDPGGGIILTLTKNNQTVDNITRWYFYRKYIVGQTGSDYFIVNETTGEIGRYITLQDWKKAIVQSKLSPTIWTRWFTDNWKFYERMFFALIFMGMFILLPLLLFLFCRLNKWIASDNKLPFRKTHLLCSIGVAAIVVVRMLLDIYPQSI